MARSATPKPIKYNVLLDAQGTQAEARKVERALQGIEDKAQGLDRALGDINLDIDIDDSAVDVLRKRLLLKKKQIEDDVRVDMDIDPTKALYQIRAVERQLKQLDRMDVTPEINVDRDRFSGALLTMGKRFGDIIGGGIGTSLSSLSSAGGGVGALVGAAAAVSLVGTMTPILVAGTSAAIAAGLAGGIVMGGKDLLSKFDTLNKQVRKTTIVFGDELENVQKWAAGLSTAIGIGKTELGTIAAGVQDLLVPKGFSRGDAADLTKQIVERGAALAEFSGLETQQGIDAVTAALLGQTRQLKTLGVEVSAVDIKARMAALKREEDYKGFSDAQLKTIATLELIKERSGDAWTAFTDGSKDAGAAADDFLDKWNATIANLKTDAIMGFGGILAEVVQELGQTIDIGIDFDDGGLAAWIKENKDPIKSAFYDFAVIAADGGIVLVEFAKAAVASVDPLLQTAEAVVKISKGLLVATRVGVFGLPAAVAISGPFDELMDSLNETDSALDTLQGAWDDFGSQATSGLDAASKGLRDLRTDIADTAAASDAVIEIKAELKAKDVDAAKATIAALSEDQLVALIATIDPANASKTEKRILELAKERQVDINTDLAGQSETERELARLSRDRVATLWLKPKFGYGSNNPSIGTPVGRSASPLSRAALPQYEYVLPSARQAPAGSVTVNNYYPKPERGSESLAMSLRVARGAVA
jgi:hypothetical protein